MPAFHDGRVVELTFAPLCCAYLKREVIDRMAGMGFAPVRREWEESAMCDHLRLVLCKRIVSVADAVVYALPGREDAGSGTARP